MQLACPGHKNREGLTMGKTSLKRLGDELDEAEREVAAMLAADRGTYFFSPDSVPFEEYVARMHRQHLAYLAYSGALTERNTIAKEKFRNRKRPPRMGDAKKYRDAKYETEDRYDTFAKLGPDFYTKREWLDASSAFAIADWKWDAANEHYQRAEREAIADRAAGINRY
jgi:hypothetical protein